MKYLYSEKESKAIDTHAIQTVGMPSLVLMEKAAMTVAAVLMKREPESSRILSICGTGNNGGDGIAVARILHQQGYSVAVTVIGDAEKMTDETKKQLEIAVGCHVPVIPFSAVVPEEFDVALDGIFGIGLSRNVEGIYENVINKINEMSLKMYALDVPSGIHAGTGKILNVAVKAQCTITFGVNKVGLVLYPGCEYAGEVIVGDIGFPTESVNSVSPYTYMYEVEDLNRIPKRPFYSNKGTFGKVLVVAGCETMSGAAVLAAKAAYTMGAGLVKVISTENNRDIILSSVPECLFASRHELAEGLEWADAVVIGPGLGISKESEELVNYVIENSPVPTVIDGDGIRLCQTLTDTLSDNFILTPHVKEMSYLTGSSVSELQQDIPGTTKDAAGEWQCIIAQKDARTVVSNGEEIYINVSGNNALATGGSGDVLAGMLGGLLGQKMEPFEASKLAVYLHGMCGDVMAAEKTSYSVMASDILEGIPKVLKTIFSK